MNRLLETLNKLQDVFTTSGVSCKDVDLPQIVVVGSQSTGKSSVLESLAQQNFLPRGTGIVTRRPLVLQMINETEPLKKNGEEYNTWAYFLHKGDTCFTEVKEIQNEIIANTNKVCGLNKGISDKAIHLKVHSTKIPSLTLVDLPGLTKIPVGDQPRDIDTQIENLVRSYIEKPNSIVLAVSAGNVDIANSDALKLAHEVDPLGIRTLAVITKVDLMEKSEESFSLLEGKTVDIKLGLIGVINRNNEQLQQDVPLSAVLKKETEFFEKHYLTIADTMGTTYLSSQLCDILIGHLKVCLPRLSEEIANQIDKHRAILEEVGVENVDKRHALITEINKYCEGIKKSIVGELTYFKHEKGKEVMTSAGSEIYSIFDKDCVKKLSLIAADQGLTNLKKTIRSTAGIQPSLFVPDGVFNTLITKQLRLFDSPSLQAIDQAHKCLKEVLEYLGHALLYRYPALQREIIRISQEFLAEQVPKANRFIKEYLAIERSYINTNHPQFVERYEVAAALFAEGDGTFKGKDFDRNAAHSNAYFKAPSGQGTKLDQLMNKHHDSMKLSEERCEKEAELMQKLLIQYFCIIRDHLIDVLPKTITKHLIYGLTSDISSVLIRTLHNESRIESLIEESDKIMRKRQHSSKMMEALSKAENLVADLRISNVTAQNDVKDFEQKLHLMKLGGG